MSLSESKRLKHNNFDFLRLLFALIVVFAHCQALTGMEELKSYMLFLSPEIAVKGFFVISGFLIFMSYERSTTLKSYATKRFRRIYPAYFTTIMICALGFSFISALPISEYFSVPFIKHLIANLGFMNFLSHDLPAVFEGNQLTAVNGALWTLKIEVMFYAAVPLIVYLCRRWKRLPCLITLYFLSVLYT